MNAGDDHIALDDEHAQHVHVAVEIASGRVRDLISIPLAQLERLRHKEADACLVTGEPAFYSVRRDAKRIEVWPAAQQDYPHFVTFEAKEPVA